MPHQPAGADHRRTFNILVRSDYRPDTVRDALSRAIFLLDMHGNGGYDAEQARILKNLIIGGIAPDPSPGAAP